MSDLLLFVPDSFEHMPPVGNQAQLKSESGKAFVIPFQPESLFFLWIDTRMVWHNTRRLFEGHVLPVRRKNT
jgi:hypothetical protein